MSYVHTRIIETQAYDRVNIKATGLREGTGSNINFAFCTCFIYPPEVSSVKYCCLGVFRKE